MSLINDALKRARQAQTRPAISPSAEGTLTAPPLLLPVEHTGREKSPRLLVMIPVVFLSLGASFWFLWKWKTTEAKAPASNAQPALAEVQTARPAKTNALALAAETMTKWQARQESDSAELPSAAKVSAQPESKKTALRETEAPIVTEPEKPASPAPAGPSASASTTPPAISRPSASAPKVAKSPALPNVGPSANVVTALGPVPKLQGIFYRLKRPTALLDGRIVSVGDDINGYRVLRIGRDTVKLTAAGRTNTLSLH
ncbi:MAG: hypothetical protein L0Z50_05605 [Verrucomicrobiales bacterium]|nr:hypothetical protein [Verrucomicrobiales bacterium]